MVERRVSAALERVEIWALAPEGKTAYSQDQPEPLAES